MPQISPINWVLVIVLFISLFFIVTTSLPILSGVSLTKKGILTKEKAMQW